MSEPVVSERSVRLTVDGQEVEVAAGSTLLDACTAAGVDTPTICWAPNLAPVNVCRLCVVELDGSRALVPACSRPAEDAMVVHTDSDRVRRSRKLVLELLGSAVDLSQDTLEPWRRRYGAEPGRFAASGLEPERVEEPVKVHDDLYVRDYARCVLCFKCVEACGDEAQHTYAIAVAGRGFETRISTEYDVVLPESACVYCGNCIAVCPTNALQPRTEFELREAGEWRPEDQTVTRTVCSYCGVGCNLDLHVQDGRVVKVTSPHDHDVTSGHLCIKGRFGWQYLQPR